MASIIKTYLHIAEETGREQIKADDIGTVTEGFVTSGKSYKFEVNLLSK